MVSVATAILLVILLIVLIDNHEKEAKVDYTTDVVKSYADEIESFLTSLEDIPNYIVFPLGNTAYREEDLRDMLRLIVQYDPDIYGTTCAFEPYKYNPDSLYYAPYYYQHNDSVFYKDLSNKEYDYFSWNWYLIPKRLGRSFWTEPYFDEGGGNITLVTYSVPIFKYTDDSKEFMGVVTVDMSLDWINKIMDHVQIKDGGFALLVSKLGTVISSDIQNKDWRLKETIFSLAEEEKWQGFREIGKKIISGQRGSDYFRDKDGKKRLVVYQPIGDSDWSFLIAVKEDKM